MRDILFRGFHKDENGKETIYLNGEKIKGNWVYGFYWTNGLGNHFIRVIKKEEDNISKFIIEDFEVIPETVGQYTGLDDKNGKKIFENDVCKGNAICDCSDLFVIKFGKYKTKYWKEKIITERTHQFGWYAEYISDNSQVHLVSPNGIEVIGTIFDKEVK